MSKKNIAKLLLISAFIVMMIVVNNRYLQLSPSTAREWILSFGVWAPIVYITFYTFRPLLFIPASILSLAAGLAFGPLWGTIYTIIGATLGAILSFIVARKLGTFFLKNRLSGPKIEAIQGQLEKNGFIYVLLLRLIPLLHFDLISYTAGISKVRLSAFTLATFIGIIPGTFAYNFLGSSLVGDNTLIVFFAILVFIIISVIPIMVSPKLREKLGMKAKEEI